MLSRDWVGGLVLVVATLGQAQQQFYTVLAPDTIRPNNNYLVAISVEGTGGDLQVSREERVVRSALKIHSMRKQVYCLEKGCPLQSK